MRTHETSANYVQMALSNILLISSIRDNPIELWLTFSIWNVLTVYVASSMQSVRVTMIGPYISDPSHGQYVSHLTLALSSSLVIMTIVADLCSHTIRQKSPKVSERGP